MLEKIYISHCNEKKCHLVTPLMQRTEDRPSKGRCCRHQGCGRASGAGTRLSLTSAPRPLLPHAPRAIGVALQQPPALQVVPGAAAQHHLRSVLIQRPRHQPPGDVFRELGFDARAGDRWKETHFMSSLCSEGSDQACCPW